MNPPVPPSSKSFWQDPRPTNENPNFVHDYFASSRLHFIGSFRARYESMIATVAQNLEIPPHILLKPPPPSKNAENVIVHVDMDCFFASVAIAKDPSLGGKCLAVAHGGGEISSCTYEAREYGIHAGMFVKKARTLCPHLISVPYEFALYEQTSIQLYTLFYGLRDVCVEAVSVDEAYLDITHVVGANQSQNEAAEAMVEDLRRRIFAMTGCRASAGIGPSKLVARLATKAAKPNGQVKIRQEDVVAYLDSLKVTDLPGVGWRTKKRFAEIRVFTVSQLRAISLEALKREFGERQGVGYYEMARAVDGRLVEPLKPRKSIGAEASWGVRFSENEGEKVVKFVGDMCEEVGNRVLAAGGRGNRVVYKVYKRKLNADMTGYKHLGHGPCTILSKSARVEIGGTGESLKKGLQAVCLRLHGELGVRNGDLRGVGLQVTDLKFADLSFDYTSGPTSGNTRRIESYFKSKGKGGGGGRAKEDVEEVDGGLVEMDDDGVDCGPEVDGENEEVEAGFQSDGEVEVDEQMGLQAGSQKNGDHVFWTQKEVMEGSEGHSEQEIEAANATEEDEIIAVVAERIEHGTNCDVNEGNRNIPRGWDKGVFLALPGELQAELLTSSRTVAGVGGRGENRQSWRGRGIKRGVSVEVGAKRTRDGRGRSGVRKRRGIEQQVTMTQMADIVELKSFGNGVLDAGEFRGRDLKGCMELMQDCKGEEERMKTRERRGEMGEIEVEIPSPPMLSGESSEESNDGDEFLARDIEGGVYEGEGMWGFAEELWRWMEEDQEGGKQEEKAERLKWRLMGMVREKRLERVCSELRLCRMFGEKISGGWEMNIGRMVEEIKDECHRLFGFRLRV